jgi:hypothetical protein
VPGPAPKDLSVRARANKASTRAELGEDDEAVEIPPLPPHIIELPPNSDGEVKLIETPWHPMTIAWWNDIWPSPMAKQWHSSDIHGLYAVAYLYDSFFRRPNVKDHAEIRLARQPYGLTPLDRRRLEWTLANTKITEGRANQGQRDNVPAPAPKSDGVDLRLVVS